MDESFQESCWEGNDYRKSLTISLHFSLLVVTVLPVSIIGFDVRIRETKEYSGPI